MTRTERWWTCTPRDFTGGKSFFVRDTGLMCLGFRKLGIDSRAVILGNPREDDEPWVVRATFTQLRSACWWDSQQIDGVVLYAWGRSEFTPIAEAIRAAGVRLVLSQDSGGLVSPVCGVRAWVLDRWNWVCRYGRWKRVAFLIQLLRGFTWGWVSQDLRRVDHLSLANRVTAVSPLAVARYERFYGSFGREDLIGCLELLPHPVSSQCRFPREALPKKNIILAVGRWEDQTQKRPDLLIDVIEITLRSDEGVRFIVFGKPTATMTAWHHGLEASLQKRVELRGSVDHPSIVAAMVEARILLVPSSFESFHIAAGEALCSGMSVVAACTVSLPSFPWFVSDGDGTLAPNLRAKDLIEALRKEIIQWNEGERDPEMISARWCDRLHEQVVATKVLGWFPERRTEDRLHL